MSNSDARGSVPLDVENAIQQLLETNTCCFRRCGVCRLDPLTTRGKRMQLAKVLCLTLLPIFGVWGFTIYTLYDNVIAKQEVGEAKDIMDTVIELGEIVHRLQRERDMTILYLSDLGSDTKSFLRREYEATDNALVDLPIWPADFQQSRFSYFGSKLKLMNRLSSHRNELGDTSNIHSETYFYTTIISEFLRGVYENIKESGFGSIWKTLVAYQKLTRCKEEIGVERAYGARFFARGSFESWGEFEYYNRKINYFRYNYKTAAYYSDLVDLISYQDVNILLNQSRIRLNRTQIIAIYRYRIQNYNATIDYKSVQTARWLFDNMSLYIDTLLELQQDLAFRVEGRVAENEADSEIKVAVYAVLVVAVVMMCPMISLTAETVASDMQKYTLVLVEKTKELNREKEKTTSLLCQMLPPSIARSLKRNSRAESEYFKCATILFSDVPGFSTVINQLSAMEIIKLVDTLYTYMDALIDNKDVYKVETINDCYMVVSGVPERNGDRHASEIASLALELQGMMRRTNTMFPRSVQHLIQLRIGVNTGACMAGVVGTMMLRYCLFGDAVNIASRMKSYGHVNMIHISEATNAFLQNVGIFRIKYRGTMDIKGKGEMKTYWVLGRNIPDGDDLDMEPPGLGSLPLPPVPGTSPSPQAKVPKRSLVHKAKTSFKKPVWDEASVYRAGTQLATVDIGTTI